MKMELLEFSYHVNIGQYPSLLFASQLTVKNFISQLPHLKSKRTVPLSFLFAFSPSLVASRFNNTCFWPQCYNDLIRINRLETVQRKKKII